MTDAGRSGRSVFQRFKTDRRMSPCRPKSGLTNETRLGEGSRGGMNHPCFPTQPFSRPGCKPIGCWLAVGPSYWGDGAVRRAVTATKTMKIETTDHHEPAEQFTELPPNRQEERECAGACTPCAPPGVHTLAEEERQENASDCRPQVGGSLCAGCAPPKRNYRVRCGRTWAHTRRGKCSALTLHTLHTPVLGSEDRRVAASRRLLRARSRAPPGVHTDPPGGAHPKSLRGFRGGVHA